jgi:hypothetical protein
MNLKLLRIILALAIFVIFPKYNLLAQVGIGTTSPDPSAILDISDITGSKGLLIPRVALIGTNSIDPIKPFPTESLLVYNTATAGNGNNAVVPGYYYWSGTKWKAMADSEKWGLMGTAGTDENINFIGTTDEQSLSLGTNNIQRFRISNADQVLALGNGTLDAPFYSWDENKTMGFWKSGNNQMNLSINNSTFFNTNAESTENLEFLINPDMLNMDFRIATINNENSFFVSGENDNFGFGTNEPDTSSQIDMADTNRGLLVNRVMLTDTYESAPISSPATGLLVYNINYSGSGEHLVAPGFYYWNSYRWVAIDGVNGNDWSAEGNYGTSAEYHFLGTADEQDFAIRTNNQERLRILSEGNVAIGSNPLSNATLRINDGKSDYGIVSEISSIGGSSIYGVENGSGDAIIGENYGTGIGVFGYAENSHGSYGTTTYSGNDKLTGGVAGLASGSNGANGMIAIADKRPANYSNIGIRAVSGSANSISTTEVLNIAINANAKDLGLYVLTEKTSGVREAARFQTNYSGSASDQDVKDPRAMLAGYTNESAQGSDNMYYGGYFYSGGNSDASWAYTGARYNGTNYKIIGNGIVSTIVESNTQNGAQKIMFAPEAPEVLFEDYGTGRLVNGIANISIDPIFSQNITVDNKHPLKVFIQLEGECNGVFVTDKTATGFKVKELQNGESNVSFSWHIVANRKDEINKVSGEKSSYTDLRFPDAPRIITAKPSENLGIEERKKKIKLSNN